MDGKELNDAQYTFCDIRQDMALNKAILGTHTPRKAQKKRPPTPQHARPGTPIHPPRPRTPHHLFGKLVEGTPNQTKNRRNIFNNVLHFVFSLSSVCFQKVDFETQFVYNMGHMNKNHSINIRITEKEKELLEEGARKHGYQSVSSYLRPKFAFLAEMEDWDSFTLLSRLSAISGNSEAETLFRSLLFVAKQKGLTVDMYEK